MTLIRFESAVEVFETYPFLNEEVAAPKGESDPISHLTRLARSETPEQAVLFLALILPRRHSVYWACGCVRALLGGLMDLDSDPAMQAALAWLKNPEEEERCHALDLGVGGSSKLPTTWLAMAAGWSGGSMAGGPGAPMVVPPPHLTARAVNAAVLLALAKIHHTQRDQQIARCIEHGVKIAAGSGG